MAFLLVFVFVFFLDQATDGMIDWYSDDKKHVIRNDVILVLLVGPDIRALLCVS